MSRRLARIVCGALVWTVPTFAAEAGIDESALTNLVTQDCGSCHGITLKGGLGKPLTPEALEHVDREALEDIILHGVPKSAMPGWAGIITDADAAWIAGALKEGRFR